MRVHTAPLRGNGSDCGSWCCSWTRTHTHQISHARLLMHTPTVLIHMPPHGLDVMAQLLQLVLQLHDHPLVHTPPVLIHMPPT